MRSKQSRIRPRSSGMEEARTRSVDARGPYSFEPPRGRDGEATRLSLTTHGPAANVRTRASIGSDTRKRHSPAEPGTGRGLGAVCEVTDHPAGARTRRSNAVGPAQRKHGRTGVADEGPRL